MGNFRKGGFDGNRGGGGFRKGGFGGGRGGFGGGRGGFGGNRGGRDGRPSEKFPAVCAECGKSCEVPFRPTGDKPVYCSACFGGRKEEQPRRNDFAPRNSGNDELNRKIASIEAKIDTILELLEGVEIAQEVEEEKIVEEKPAKKSKKK